MSYTAEIGGKVASIGGRLLDGAARVIIGQFFAALARQAGGGGASRRSAARPAARPVRRAVAKPAAFDYVRAGSVDEALAVSAEAGSDARIMAGGQSPMAMLNMRLARPKVLIDIMRLPDLAGIGSKVGVVTIGAGVRQASLLAWPISIAS